jgi:hypothetical protein
MNGKSVTYDPAALTVTDGSAQYVTDVARADHFVTIANHRLRVIWIRVNGVRVPLDLRHSETVPLNLGALFKPGSHNRVAVQGQGRGHADVLIWDGNGARPNLS